MLRKIPNITISTDIIVGFPGEEEKDFQETIEVLKKVRYHEIFSFKYCDRPFAVASNFPEKIPEKEKERRLKAEEKRRSNEEEVRRIKEEQIRLKEKEKRLEKKR